MPDEDRVFDVSKPGKSNPSATSKPIIVGHRPTMADPMMRTDTGQDITAEASAAATRINVMDTPLDPPSTMTEPAVAGPAVEGLAHSSWNGAVEDNQGSGDVAPAIGSVAAGSETVQPESEISTEEPQDAFPQSPSDAPVQPDAPLPIEPIGHVEGLHLSPPKKRKSPVLLILISLLVLIIVGYLLVDSGTVKTSIKLPVHVFKQETPAPAKPAAAADPTVAPAGFTLYKIATTNINFDAPTAWGEPTSTTDPGYSKRSADAKSDGAHAFIIDFATNKDVQVSITSAKYLPATRTGTAPYYDFLQWCNGTSDSKTYLGLLQFTTVAKVDTATTVSCNQGPITDETKVNTTTIVELNTKDSTGAAFGDLYTKNTTDKEFVVFRVKDKSMKNSADIKKLLNTVKSSAI